MKRGKGSSSSIFDLIVAAGVMRRLRCRSKRLYWKNIKVREYLIYISILESVGHLLEMETDNYMQTAHDQ